MKRARVVYADAIHDATPQGETHACLADHRIVRADEVVWPPPLEVGTILALGLNYADQHRKSRTDSRGHRPPHQHDPCQCN